MHGAFKLCRAVADPNLLIGRLRFIWVTDELSICSRRCVRVLITTSWSCFTCGWRSLCPVAPKTGVKFRTTIIRDLHPIPWRIRVLLLAAHLNAAEYAPVAEMFIRRIGQCSNNRVIVVWHTTRIKGAAVVPIWLYHFGFILIVGRCAPDFICAYGFLRIAVVNLAIPVRFPHTHQIIVVTTRITVD